VNCDYLINRIEWEKHLIYNIKEMKEITYLNLHIDEEWCLIQKVSIKDETWTRIMNRKYQIPMEWYWGRLRLTK